VANDNPGTPKRCPDGKAHSWAYRGKATQLYSCNLCAYEITKAELKAATDA